MSVFSKSVARRSVVKGAAGAGVALAMPTIFTSAMAATYRNDPGKNPNVIFGFNVPLTGSYADEGADELRAYQLAVKHLNGEGDGGMLKTMKPTVLKGNGVLGKKVTYVSGDSQTKADAARASAQRMIEKDGAIMITGGSSSAEAVAVQGLCQEAGIIFMAGLTHSNDTTGKDKKANGFRHFINTEMSGAALGPVVEKAYGKGRKVYHLTADYTWGWSQEGSIDKYTKPLGWEVVAAVKTPVGTPDFSQYLTPVLNSGADMLVLNEYGRDMINSLTQAVQFGLNKKEVNGKKFEILVPLYSTLMANGAGDNIKGIYGTTNWHWTLQDAGSKAFVASFGKEYGFPPSEAAHTCYVQTLLYADAAERAGTFHPCEIVKALEDFKFDGLGNGPTLYRGSDHQCFKPILVVKGKENPKDQYDRLEIVEQTPTDKIIYDPAIFGGDLGKCNAGV